MPRVQFEKIVKSFGRVTVLKNLDLEIEDGEFVVLLGPSGCGKTTLLNLLAGLIDVSAGRIQIGERDVTDLDPKDRGLAMVFQSYALYPTKTVRGNMKFGMAAAKLDKDEQERRIAWAAKLLQIESLLDRSRASFRAASGNAWRSAAPWSNRSASSSSTNRSPISTPSSGPRPGSRSSGCTTRRNRRSSM